MAPFLGGPTENCSVYSYYVSLKEIGLSRATWWNVLSNNISETERIRLKHCITSKNWGSSEIQTF